MAEPLRILIISYHFPPSNSVAAMRPYSWAKTYSELGHDVTVLTSGNPNARFPLQLDMTGIRILNSESKFLCRVRAYFGRSREIGVGPPTSGTLFGWVRSFLARRGVGFLGRLPDAFDLLRPPSMTLLGSSDHWDLVMTTYAPRYCHALGYVLKNEGRASVWVADFRDLWVGHHQFSGIWPFQIIEAYLEHKYLKQADIVTSVSPELVAVLQSKSNTQVRLLPNGFSRSLLQGLDPTISLEPKRINLVYTGTLYPGWLGVPLLLEALNRTRRTLPGSLPDLRITIAGSDQGEFSKMVADSGMAELFCFVGEVSRQVSLRLQRDADVLLFFDHHKLKGIATGKLYEYISAGPIIWNIGGNPDSFGAEIIRKTATGVTCGKSAEVLSGLFENLLTGQKPTIKANEAEVNLYERSKIASTFLAELQEHSDFLK